MGGTAAAPADASAGGSTEIRYEAAGGSFGTLNAGFGAESVSCAGGKCATRAESGARADASNCCIDTGTEAAADCATAWAEMFGLLALSAAFGGPTVSAECSPFASDTVGPAVDEAAEVAHSSAFCFFGGRPTRGRDDCSPFAVPCALCSLLRR